MSGRFRRWLDPRAMARGWHGWSFLAKSHGVIHVGANTGQERYIYNLMRLKVLWIEAAPSVFEVLKANIAGFSRQKAVQAVITDRDGDSVTFHVANNNGESSSIMELDRHAEIWPEVHFTSDIVLQTATLPSLLLKYGIPSADYDALVLDTQGSELMVLNGASPLLERVRFVKTEVADFSAYKGGVQRAELTAFLGERGFAEHRAVMIAEGRSGRYFDVIYKKRA